MSNRTVRPFWNPASMMIRQFASSIEFALALGWGRFPKWLFKNGLRTLPVSAGAVGMGCIGFPNHPVWEVTSKCNLRCKHCHVASDLEGIECDHETALRTIDGIPAFSGSLSISIRILQSFSPVITKCHLKVI